MYSTTVTVAVLPLPTATFTATPSSLPIGGGPTKLKWTSLNATNVAIAPGIGSVNLNDSLTVTDTATTTYTLTVSNTMGSNSYNLTVTVAVTIPPSVGDSIYFDKLLGKWGTVQSWTNTITLNNTTNVKDGTYSLKSVIGAWGVLQFAKGTWGTFTSMNRSDYVNSKVQFWVYGTSGKSLLVSVWSGNANSATSKLGVVTVATAANAWTLVSIPVTTLVPATAAQFEAIEIGVSDGSAQTFYFDDAILTQ
jgi:hypothetical protein